MFRFHACVFIDDIDPIEVQFNMAHRLHMKGFTSWSHVWDAEKISWYDEQEIDIEGLLSSNKRTFLLNALRKKREL